MLNCRNNTYTFSDHCSLINCILLRKNEPSHLATKSNLSELIYHHFISILICFIPLTLLHYTEKHMDPMIIIDQPFEAIKICKLSLFDA